MLACVALMTSGAARADTYSFAVLPADVTGPAGSTVGWGYSITNESTSLWLLPTALNPGLFDHGIANNIFDFPVIAPTATVSVSFDSISGAGLYELTWDATAPTGFVNSGTFDLQAEWWDNDPSNSGNLVGDAPQESAAYSATVSGTASLPEPSGLWLLVSIAGLLSLQKVRRRFSNFVRV